MLIDRAGWPFVLVAALVALVGGLAFGRVWAVPGLVLAAFFLFFFRDPDRRVPSEAGLVVSPADGRVMVAGGPPQTGAPEGNWHVISIFLSPLDVHVNRMPAEGRVTRVEYHPGAFLPAYRADAGALNEWTEVWLERGGRSIVVRQIVGVLARRIVCRVRVGQDVSRGERFGVMKFGSRMDVFLPPDARIRVRAGDRVVGGETPLASLEP
jgi:phosphatidylserine decarboxylase